MHEYFKNIHQALKEFHAQDEDVDAFKPLYILIKVDVDRDIVYNQEKADTYAINHCNSFEYELVDHYYPDDEQYPYIAK